jgi:YD repeat-containing protein
MGSFVDHLAYLDSHARCRTRRNDCFYVDVNSCTQRTLVRGDRFCPLERGRRSEKVSEEHSVDNPEITVISFKCDPFGRRIQKAFTQGSTTTTTNYVYDGNNSVEDVDQNGILLARYAETQIIDESLAESRSGTMTFEDFT